MIASIGLLGSLWLIGDALVKLLLVRTNLSFASSFQTTANATKPNSCGSLCYNGKTELYLVRFAFGLTMGLLLGGWLFYLSGCAIMTSRRITLMGIHPIIPAIVLCYIVAVLIIIWRFTTATKRLPHHQKFGKTLRFFIAQTPYKSVLIFSFVFVIFYLFLNYSFFTDGTNNVAGASVFSDLGAHTGLISSFAKGENFPADFPSFTNAGMRYHFIFFLVPAAFNTLGASLPFALNLPSAMSLAIVAILLGFIGKKFSSWRAAWWLVPLLVFLRSSFAFFAFMRNEILILPTWEERIKALANQVRFIGYTPRDDWGLWTSNVWANQRHLALGFAVVLVTLIVIWSDVGDLNMTKPWFKSTFLRRDCYLPETSEIGKYFLLGLMLTLLPFIHGSMLITALLIVGVMAIFIRHRLVYLVIAFIATLSALVQSQLLTSGATLAMQFKFQFGFIVPEPNFINIVKYMLQIGGIAIFLILLFSFGKKKLRRAYWFLAALAPIVFAFTCSMTPDITVNHKYIFVSFALFSVIVVDILHQLWCSNTVLSLGIKIRNISIAKLLNQSTALILIFCLTITGAYELLIYRNLSQIYMVEPRNSALTQYLEQNTAPSALFITGPYHYNAFYFSGRRTFLGHEYYGWSAGYDTAGRHEILKKFFAEKSPTKLQALARERGFDYLIVDDTLRANTDYNVNEAWLQQAFPNYEEIAELGRPIVYKLR